MLHHRFAPVLAQNGLHRAAFPRTMLLGSAATTDIGTLFVYLNRLWPQAKQLYRGVQRGHHRARRRRDRPAAHASQLSPGNARKRQRGSLRAPASHQSQALVCEERLQQFAGSGLVEDACHVDAGCLSAHWTILRKRLASGKMPWPTASAAVAAMHDRTSPGRIKEQVSGSTKRRPRPMPDCPKEPRKARSTTCSHHHPHCTDPPCP
ncbi:hypothetical protein BCR44DRAFT_1434956 [Catenaria anguillulae PL171]|uniref:Uncharacterized protein n=1 Tax=Catenaria anguillulae PL171 TaxID=765915 RepID=A0A1Y2HKF5_9FUNG|nr:hypothetical protein BCR44DRAFT_1434956 [Catenaria anguillulae PL171]